MFSSSQYLATIAGERDAFFAEHPHNFLNPDNGLAESSALKISEIISFTLVLETVSPPPVVCSPAVKKKLISKMPCGVSMYLPETARLTLVSCTPTTSAVCAIVIGFRSARHLFPMKSRWRFTVSRPMLPMVCSPRWCKLLIEEFSGASVFADVILHLGIVFAHAPSNLYRRCRHGDAGRCRCWSRR